MLISNPNTTRGYQSTTVFNALTTMKHIPEWYPRGEEVFGLDEELEYKCPECGAYFPAGAKRCTGCGTEFAGAVLRPHAYAMDRDPGVRGSILASVREAGRQLVVDGRMNPETLDEISRPLMTFEECIEEQTRQYLEVKDRMGKHP